MLELVPVAFQSMPLLVLLLTLQGMGTLPAEATIVKHLRGRKRGPDDRIHGKRMLQRPNELRENHTVLPSTGKTVPSRSTGEACSCRNKCYDLFSPEEKDAVIEAFNALSNKELQDAHLFGLITSKDVKRRRPRQTMIRRQERKASYTYHVSTFLATPCPSSFHSNPHTHPPPPLQKLHTK